MSKNNSIVVTDLESLLKLMQAAEFWVKWQVLCDIGPGWIGGGLEICFYLNEQPLADTSFHSQLKAALRKIVPIPSESPNALIDGEGVVQRTDDALEIAYEWSKTFPYAESVENGHGTAELIRLAVLSDGH